MADDCGHCKFFLSGKYTGATDFCRRYPPVVVGTQHRDRDGNVYDEIESHFPDTQPGSWCGEFRKEPT